jgi:HPt (histidine-containing phosphotransfer) domain-containing protein
VAGSAQELLQQAAAKLDQAQTALDAGNLGEYQTLVEQAHTLVKAAAAKGAG